MIDVVSLSAELEIHGVRHFRVILCDELGAVKKIRVHCDFLLLKKSDKYYLNNTIWPQLKSKLKGIILSIYAKRRNE